MNFDELIAPFGKEKFFEGFQKGTCMVIQGEPNRFSNLISLEDIERKLNDGCNTIMPPQIIGSGKRASLVDEKLRWTPLSSKKSEIHEALKNGQSFLMPNSSQINAQVSALLDSIEESFTGLNVQADVHLYVSPKKGSTAYNAHRDFPQHKLYLQVIGSTHWQVFKSKQAIKDDVRSVTPEGEAMLLEKVADFELNAGSVFYMPPAVFHKVHNPHGPRVSISIPFVPSPKDVKRMDRSFIPFKEIFEGKGE